MLIKNRRRPPIHINPVCIIQNIVLNGVSSNMHIIFVDTGVTISRRKANSMYAKIGVHLVKGWVVLERDENTACFADVGDFLDEHHKTDLDREMKALYAST